MIALAMWRTVVRRRQRLRPRLGDRGVPVPARAPGPARSTSAASGGRSAVAAAAESRAAGKRRRGDRRREDRCASCGEAPVHLAPGRHRPALADPDARPLHHVAHAPPGLQLDAAGGRSSPSRASRPGTNYSKLFHNSDDHARARGPRSQIAIGGTSCRSSSPRSPATRSPGSSFPGRDWLFIVVIALLVVPLQMALIPMFKLYNTLGLFDTILGLVLFHTAFGAPVRDLPPAQLLHRDPEGRLRVGAHRRRFRSCASSSGSSCRSGCRRSPRWRSSSSSGCGTTCSSH